MRRVAAESFQTPRGRFSGARNGAFGRLHFTSRSSPAVHYFPFFPFFPFFPLASGSGFAAAGALSRCFAQANWITAAALSSNFSRRFSEAASMRFFSASSRSKSRSARAAPRAVSGAALRSS